MKLKIEFAALDNLIRRMGAVHSSWTATDIKLSERQILRRALEDGKEVSAGEVGNLGGLLEHEGEQILLYIKDTRRDKVALLNHPEDSSKYHIAECSTLSYMRNENRFPRYHAANRLDGKFNCAWIDSNSRESGEVLAELNVCRNCLKEIDWKGYGTKHQEGTRNEIVQAFDIADFLRTYESLFYNRPDKNSSSKVSSTYVKNWGRISKDYRASRSWCCEECSVDLSEKKHRKLLHTHHINGVLGDNTPLNFKALCVLCHAKQPKHGHMKPTAHEYAIVESLRAK